MKRPAAKDAVPRIVVRGRPDFYNRDFGRTEAKKFPPYVYSTDGTGCLVHKIARVELYWYRVGGVGDYLVRLNEPRMTAYTVCGAMRYLTPRASRTCVVPDPDAILCGRCHGDVATFGKYGPALKAGITRREAHTKLGCVVEGVSP